MTFPRCYTFPNRIGLGRTTVRFCLSAIAELVADKLPTTKAQGFSGFTQTRIVGD